MTTLFSSIEDAQSYCDTNNVLLLRPQTLYRLINLLKSFVKERFFEDQEEDIAHYFKDADEIKSFFPTHDHEILKKMILILIKINIKNPELKAKFNMCLLLLLGSSVIINIQQQLDEKIIKAKEITKLNNKLCEYGEQIDEIIKYSTIKFVTIEHHMYDSNTEFIIFDRVFY